MANKIRQLEVCADELELDLLLLTEHWQTRDQLTMCNMRNMKLLSYYCRTESIHGGVAIYGTNRLKYRRLSILDNMSISNVFECCGVEIVNCNVIVIVVYRVPSSDFNQFLDAVCGVLESVCDDNKNVVVGGDFNINLSVCDKQSTAFIDLIRSFNLITLIREPTRVTTRSSTCIDNIIINESFDQIYNAKVIKTYMSDHYGQLLSFQMVAKINPDSHDLVRDFNTSNMDTFCNLLKGESWSSILNEMDTNKAFNNFNSVIQQYFNTSFPERKAKVNARKSIRKTPEVLELRRHLSLVGNLCKQYDIFKETFTKLNRAYTSALNDLKKNEISNKLTLAQNKTKRMWQIVNDELGRNKVNEKIIIKQNDKYLTDKEVAVEFSKHFTEIPKPLSTNQLSVTNTLYDFKRRINIPESFYLAPVTPLDVEYNINKMKNTHSAGIDNISNAILRQIKGLVSVPLAHVINRSFVEGIFPGGLKHNKVIPVYKHNCRETLSNYRPITLVSSFSKLIEMLVNENLLSFLDKHGVLQSFQHGFIRNKSVNSALNEFITSVIQAIDKKTLPLGLFIDLTKAFDTVDHTVLLNKLEIYGIRGVSMEWFRSYLSNRTIQVRVGRDVSDDTVITSGVPQGSVLGPTLFLLYVNDLADCVKSESALIVNYADDTNILVLGENVEDIQLKTDYILNKITEWTINNKLIVNVDKTKAVLFNNKCSVNKLHLNDSSASIKVDRSAQMLGLVIDADLNWHEHIQLLCSKLARTIYGLKTLSRYCELTILRTQYFACFQCHLKYGITHWGRSAESQRVFVLQKRAIRTMCKLSPRDSCKDAFKSLQIMTLPSLYIYEILCFAFCNKDKFRGAEYHYETRHKSHTLVNEIHSTSKYQKQTLYNACRFFNHLSRETKSIASLKAFKSYMKKALINSTLYDINEFFSVGW